MTFILRALTLFAFLVSAQAWAEPAADVVRLVLKSEAIVSTNEVRLRDVAEITVNKPSLQRSLEDLLIAPAPRVGYVEQVTRLQLNNLLKARQESAASQIEWAGASLTKIRTSAQTVAAADLSAAAVDGVRSQLGNQFPSLEIKPGAAPKDVSVPNGDLTLRIRPIDSNQLYAKIAVWVDILVNGSIYRSVVVPLYLHLDSEVLIAKRNIPEGSSAVAADFEIRKENVVGVNGVLAKSALVGSSPRLRKAIAQGQILTSKHLVQTGAVLRGDWVKLIYIDAAISLETRALAEQNGQIGDVISLKLNNNADSITGRIVAAGVVEAQGR